MSGSPPPGSTPMQEPAALLRIERAFFVQMSFETVLYGLTLCLYINLLKKGGFRFSWKLITFLTVQQIAQLIGIIGNIHLTMLSFVDNRNTPGGPAAFEAQSSNGASAFSALSAFTISTWLQDVLLLYRFLVIWHGNYLIFILPLMIFLASVAFSLILLVQNGFKAGLLSTLSNFPVQLIFFSLSVGLNVVLTTLIVGRLLYYRRKLSRTLGFQHTKSYVTTMAIVIESAALYTCVGIAQVVAIRTDIAVATGIQGLYAVVSATAPHLIAFRVSQGRAWTREMSNKSSAEFARPSGSMFTSGDNIVLSSRGGGSTTKIGPEGSKKENTEDDSHFGV